MINPPQIDDVTKALATVNAQLDRAQDADPAVQRDAYRQASQAASHAGRLLAGLAAALPADQPAQPAAAFNWGVPARPLHV